jgi:hypothetical protein
MVPSRSGNKVKKQLFKPRSLSNIQEVSGASWQFTTDCRLLTKSTETETQVETQADTRERPPSPITHTTEFSPAQQAYLSAALK